MATSASRRHCRRMSVSRHRQANAAAPVRIAVSANSVPADVTTPSAASRQRDHLNRWSRWRLAALGVVTSAGTLFAETAILTGAAAFACLCLETLIRRQWRRLAEVAITGAGTLAIYGVIFVLVVRPRIDPT